MTSLNFFARCKRGTCALALGLVAQACGSTPSSSLPVAKQLLVTLVDDVYLPSQARAAADMTALASSINALCSAPTPAALVAAQQAWRVARAGWKPLDAMQLGPALSQRIADEMDFWPVRDADIESEIAAATPLTAAYLNGVGATRKGLPVIEYLLFADPARVTGPEQARICEYLVAAADHAVARADALVSAWRADGGNFRAQLVDAGSSASMYDSVGAGLNETGNAMIAAAENIEGLRLAKPLGRRDGGVPQPTAVESRFADNARDDLVHTLAGVRAVYTGTLAADGAAQPTAVSFSSYIRGRDRALDDEVRSQLAACEASALAWPRPLDELVTGEPSTAEATFACTKDLLSMLKADVAGLVGITVTFGDVDGD